MPGEVNASVKWPENVTSWLGSSVMMLRCVGSQVGATAAVLSIVTSPVNVTSPSPNNVRSALRTTGL
jgi:hypothetical protein